MAVAINQESIAPWSHHKPSWHRTAPRRVVEKYTFDDPLGGWTAWQNYLARRKRPVHPGFHQGKAPPLLWGWAVESDAAEFTRELLDIDRLIRIVFEEPSSSIAPDVPESLQMLAIAYALPDLGQELSAQRWWHFGEQLHDLAIDARQQRVDLSSDPHDYLRHQLLAGELPLALSYLLPEIRPLRELRKSARSALSDALVDVTDGQGLPHARLLTVLGPLFACWTRARWIGGRLDHGPWSRRAEYQYQWLVRHAIRLADNDRRFVLAPRNIAWSKPLLSLALDLAGDDGDCAAATAALPGRVVPKQIKFDANDLPDPSLNSDWSGITVMSDRWSRSAVRLAVSYAHDPVHIDLSAGGERLFAGAWTCETTCDGMPVRVAGEWEQLCWQSDKHADFLELGVDLAGGLRLERQLLFGKKDRVLYLADMIIATDGNTRRLSHSMHLPLDNAARWHRETETRDGRLYGRKLRAAVMPLALSEWRSDPRGGELTEQNGRLVLAQQSHGRGLCCPLFFDLKPGRARKERTWRQLTVAESMEIVPRDVAAGFRVQSSRDQWLIYRSLAPAGNRTVLGQNIAGEFCVGRFRTSGRFDEWLEIEAV